jgi:AAA domain
MATPVPRPIGKAPPQSAPGKTSRLGAVKRGQLRSALRYMFYGPEGVGKSSLLADVKDIILADVEGGSDNIDVPRYMFRDEEGGHVPRSYAEVVGMVEDLIANPGHGYSALGLDTADALEALIHRHICEQHGKSSIEEFGFGKGYQVALDEMRRFLALLDRLRAQGVEIVIVGHSIVKTFKNPEGEDYDRYQLRVHDKLGGLVKEWCDVVGFIRFDGGAAKLKGDMAQTKRARGWATGKRIVHLARDAAWDAKSRLSMPSEITLDVAHPWAPFAAAQRGARDSTVESLRADINAELDRICGVGQSAIFMTASGRNTNRAEVLDMVEHADASTLNRILNGLQATASVKES